ncbi:MAG: hypothetical protein Fur0042_26920 [Cyanophyceae cyanobacterium]
MGTLGRVVALALVAALCLGMPAAIAGPLGDRVAAFPQWLNKPPVRRAVGDLTYPDWMAGTWSVESTLIEMVAPLAPKVISPGYDSNRQFLDRPLTFTVRFGPQAIAPAASPIPVQARPSAPPIVADRAFNGENISRAYLGDAAKIRVSVDSANPNRQITTLSGDRQLLSEVIGRAIEPADPDTFITTELSQQAFRRLENPGEIQPGDRAIAYLNLVETTTVYRHRPDAPKGDAPILGDQMTAIFLNPRDNDYPRVRDRPVALYRYHLEFQPVPPDAIASSEAPAEAR